MVTGPNIIEDGLVFGYDADDRSTRFYPGEPAVNCSQPLTGNNWATNMPKSEIIDGTVKPPRINARVFKVTAAVTDNNWMRFGGYYNGGNFAGGNAAPLLLGKTSPSNYTTVGTGKYRFGFWVRGSVNNSAANIYIDIGDRNGASTTVNNTNWQFISTTDANSINSTTYPYDFFDVFFTGAAGNIFYISDLMIVRSPGTVDNLPTLQTYPQWIDYEQERSYNNSLIDLKKTTTINLSNVSFDSTAHPIFDGTDDKIQTTYAPQFGDFTICLVFKDNGSASWGRIIDKSYSTGVFISSNFASIGQYYVGAGIIEPNSPHGQALPYTPGQYHFFTVVRNGTTHTIYLDGITQTASKTGSRALLDSTSIAFGAWSGSVSQPYKGWLPIVDIYNRALLPSEILQNFNSYKTRFGIL